MGSCARSSTDRASDYGSEGWEFESLRARSPSEFKARLSFSRNPVGRPLADTATSDTTVFSVVVSVVKVRVVGVFMFDRVVVVPNRSGCFFSRRVLPDVLVVRVRRFDRVLVNFRRV